MTFDEVLGQMQELLRREKRVSYRGLKRRFALDDEYLEDLKEELIGAKRIAADEDGRFLVWAGGADPATEAAASAAAPAPSAQPKPASADYPEPDAERRQLTVMFCDLVGSTSLSEQLDPEELREVVGQYQTSCEAVIERFEGYVARYQGDGLLVYFGYPAAQEDAAERAIHAGLGIVAALPTLNARLHAGVPLQHERPLQVRIGIHSGLVVVGEMGRGAAREQVALGETPNIAARVQGKAEPDCVVISTATQRLVHGLFECENLGPQELKGITTPLALYRVVAESAAQSHFAVAVRAGLTRLVGREHEVGLLQDRWQQATGGQGQAVSVSGEAGIGKSRLVQELQEQVVKEGGIRIAYRYSPYHQNSALYPVIAHVEKVLEIGPEDAPAAKLGKLQRALSTYRFPQADTLPLLAALLSLPHPEGSPPITVSPQKQKEQTQGALMAWLFEEADKAPVCCTWEDLHWADPSSLEFLNLCLDQIPTAHMLTLLTFRPEFTPPWDTHSYLSQLTLNRLGPTDVGAMVEEVTRGKSLPAEVLQQITTKTDGVPLFVEELTKMVLESDLVRAVNGHYEVTRPLPPLAIPSTLQDSLMARLDRLAAVKEVAQLGATLGREFSYALLAAVSPLDDAGLQRGLQQLVTAELIYQRGLPPQARYVFKHALIQDTAYQSLLKSSRQQYHRQIAHVLEARFPETVETQPELLAHHYTQASLAEQAISYWQQAGENALRRSAHREAIGHFRTALDVLRTLPESPERNKQELTLHVALCPPLAFTKNYGSAEVEQVYSRAQELCAQVGEASQLFPALYGVWQVNNQRPEHAAARAAAKQLLSLAQSVEDVGFLLEAHLAMGTSLSNLGELVSAREHLEAGMALYDPDQHRSHIAVYWRDPGVGGLSIAAWALWRLGYPDQALESSHQMVAVAEESLHPFSLAWALHFAGLLHRARGENPAAQERAEAVIALCTEHGFPVFLAWGTAVRGAALAAQGQAEEGLAQIRQGLAVARATGGELAQSSILTALAVAHGKVGQADDGLATVAEALAFVDRTEERMNEAELYRLKGELSLQSQVQSRKPVLSAVKGSQVEEEAEACFQKAIEVARRQSAKSWELRAATSLARLWQQQGKVAEARDLLAPVYNWFTEGLDTADLNDAQALLEELN